MRRYGGLWSRFLVSSRKNMDLDYAAKRWPKRMAIMLPWLVAALVAGVLIYVSMGA